MTERLLGRLLLASSIVIVLGSLLPWHLVRGLGGTELNIDGVDSPNNGVVTLVLGVVLAALGWRMVDGGHRPRRAILTVSIATAAAAVWALLDARNAESDLVGGSERSSREILRAAVELDRAYGQWVLMAGVVVTLLVALAITRRPRAGEESGESTLS